MPKTLYIFNTSAHIHIPVNDGNCYISARQCTEAFGNSERNYSSLKNVLSKIEKRFKKF